MLEPVRKDIIDVLGKAIKFISDSDVKALNDVSNHTVHNSFIYQDEDSISIAVIIYSFSKIIERGAEIKDATLLLKHARNHLVRQEIHEYKHVIRKLTRLISNVDSKFKLYIQDIIEKAHIKKGSKLYNHGISLAQSASLLGISQWELMSYVGKTQINDNYPSSTRAGKRLDTARRLFQK